MEDGREYPLRPWAGVGVVVWKGDEILLIRRGKAPRSGEWSIPGGAVHLGETVYETACREVREETGIAVRPLGFLTVVDAISTDSDGKAHFHYVLTEIAALYESGELVSGDDATECRWASIDEAIALVVWEETRKLLRLAADRRRQKNT